MFVSSRMLQDIITTNVHLRNLQELKDFVLLMRKLRRKRIPLEIRAVGVWIVDANHYDIGTLFREISPEHVVIFHLKWQNFRNIDVDELAIVVSDLSSLLDFRLECATALSPDESNLSLPIAIGMHSMLTECKGIKKLTLRGFPIAGHGEHHYILPLDLSELHLTQCTLRYSDFGAWAKKSKSGTIKTLRIVDCTVVSRGDNSGNLGEFVSRHASTLRSLSLDIRGFQPSMPVVRGMSQQIASNRILLDFNYHNATRNDLLDVLMVSMPWVMNTESLLRFSLSTAPSTEEDSDELRDLVRNSLRALYARKRRLVLIGSVLYCKA